MGQDARGMQRIVRGRNPPSRRSHGLECSALSSKLPIPEHDHGDSDVSDLKKTISMDDRHLVDQASEKAVGDKV
jgi:hypothetical protein